MNYEYVIKQLIRVVVPILGQNGFCTHARPAKVNLGVPKFGTLFHLFLYKHDFIGTKLNMELLGAEPLESKLG
jgi:hypothetical protein